MRPDLRSSKTLLASALSGVLLVWSPAAWAQKTTANPAPPPDSAAPPVVSLESKFADRPLAECRLTQEHVRGDYSSVTWPNGRVPYEFAANVSKGQRSAMLAAMYAIDEVTANVDFVPRNGETAYLYIQDANSNNAPIGYWNGAHTVNIYNWNIEFVMVHELMHTLGIYHEQSRPDRDAYVRIESSHIEPGMEGNFAIATGSVSYGPYDFESVMHYPACGFSTCGSCNPSDAACRTITVLAPYAQQWQSAIGQNTHLSAGDIAVLRYLYDGFPNDTCATAIPIQDGTTRFLSTGAAVDTPPSCSGRATASLWYDYTATSTGVVTAFTCASSFDTLLSAYAGICGALTQIACNDDAGGSQLCGDPYQSAIQFPVIAGQTYKIRVGGYDGATGRGFLYVSSAADNSTCSGSLEILEGTTQFSTAGLASQEHDPCTGMVSAGRWFVFWPTHTGRYLIDTCGSSFDTTLTISSGPCNALGVIACNDDAQFGACSGSPQSAVEANFIGGLGYRIRVAGYNGATGAGNINVRWFPNNDRCTGAIEIGNETVEFDPSGADLSNPICTDLAPTGLWYRYTATCTGVANANTCGSMIDTVLSVAGGDCGQLNPISCNDDALAEPCPGTLSSVVNFPVVNGSTYLIRVGGYGGIGGACVLTLSCIPTQCLADINGDRRVDIADLAILLAHFGLSGGQTQATGDLTGDGNVELSDLAQLLARFGMICD
jgi:hypothetical protein